MLGTAPWEAGHSACSIAPREHPPCVVLVPGTGALSFPGVWALGLGSEGDVVVYAVSSFSP